MLEFIQQAVLEKIDDDEFVDKFVKKEFYLTEDGYESSKENK